MATGYQHIIEIHEDSTGTVVLDSVRRVQFTHDNSLVSPVTNVVKENFTATPNDAFVVKISYPSGSEPALSTTLNTLLTTAKNAVNAVYGNGEAGPATA